MTSGERRKINNGGGLEKEVIVVTMVEGWKLVPHLPEYFIDNLHPNQLGTEVYAGNLVREIERLHF